jgi:hypothetical protein
MLYFQFVSSFVPASPSLACSCGWINPNPQPFLPLRCRCCGGGSILPHTPLYSALITLFSCYKPFHLNIVSASISPEFVRVNMLVREDKDGILSISV